MSMCQGSKPDTGCLIYTGMDVRGSCVADGAHAKTTDHEQFFGLKIFINF